MGGNDGQATYDYPLQVAPGAAGFAPKLVLHYSSSDPNNRHSRTSPAGDVGDGWSLTLGSISAQNYANFSDRLVADTTNHNGTFFQTQHLSHYLIQQVTSSQTNQPCFHVWDPSGTYYEFGCTPDALEWTNTGSQQNYQWNLNRIVAPNEGPAAPNVGYDLIDISYLQDCSPAPSPSVQPCPSSATVRDAAIKQITYANGHCTGSGNPSSPLTTSYTGYDAYGNAVASVDAVAQANSSLYSGEGCSASPVIKASAWSLSTYSSCTSYQNQTVPLSMANAFNQSSSTAYSAAEGLLPTQVTDANGQVTTTAYSYDSNSANDDQYTVSISLPGEQSGSYTSKSTTNSACAGNFPSSITHPCYEIDTVSSQYPNAVSRTFYASLGRAVETQTPGPDGSHTTVQFTVYNDQQNSLYQSLPFIVNSISSWLDPNSAVDENGQTPGGTATYNDALGRAVATDDALFNAKQTNGIVCDSLGNSAMATTCAEYWYGTVSGDATTYLTTFSIDANNHLVMTYSDALGRVRYVQYFSGVFTGGSSYPTINEQKSIQYNALGEPTSVMVTDVAPQSGQSMTSVTTTASYDDLGRMTTLNDPERGNHTYTYDADGRVINDSASGRSIGYNYDLLGRVGCINDAATTVIDANGTCTGGSNPFVQNTYDLTELGMKGNTDFPIGQLTQSVATTYFPGPDYSQGHVTQQFQHDNRGQLITEQQQITLSGGSLTMPTMPTNAVSYSYNDANQPTTTTTSVGGATSYTFSQAYDGTTGVLNGLSNNSTGLPTWSPWATTPKTWSMR